MWVLRVVLVFVCSKGLSVVCIMRLILILLMIFVIF